MKKFSTEAQIQYKQNRYSQNLIKQDEDWKSAKGKEKSESNQNNK